MSFKIKAVKERGGAFCYFCQFSLKRIQLGTNKGEGWATDII